MVTIMTCRASLRVETKQCLAVIQDEEALVLDMKARLKQLQLERTERIQKQLVHTSNVN